MLKSSAFGRIVLAGLAAGLAVAVLGWTLERIRFGASDAEAIARVEAEIQQRFDAGADNLGTIAARAASETCSVALSTSSELGASLRASRSV